MTKIFIIGISSKLARKFVIDHNLINISILGTYNKNNITKLFTKDQLKNNSKNKFLKIDLTKSHDLKKITNILIKYQPDIIINFSSIIVRRKKFENINFRKLIKVFNLNFFSQLRLYLKICSKLNKLKKNISIINISSKVILNGGYKIYEYSTSKAATANLFKSLQREYKNIRFINYIIPGVGEREIKKDSISFKLFVSSLSNIIKKIKKSKHLKSDIIL